MFTEATCRPLTSQEAKRAKQHTGTGRGRWSLFKIWRAFMVGDARLLIWLLLENRQVAPVNTAVLTLKPGNQTQSRLTQLIIVVNISMSS